MNGKTGWAIMTAAAVFMAGCGGGGGGTSAGTAAAGVTSGTITGFGSVIVNGVRYRTSGATEFDVDDGPGGQDDLAVGQQVTVRWTSSDGGRTFDAAIVRYDDTLEGPIAANSIDLVAGTFVVLGQPVQVSAVTSFDDDVPGRTLAGLAAGNRVEVSGLIDANGVVQATRVELDDDDDDEFEVRGFVAGLDPVARTFVINSLVIDYGSVVAPPGLADGMLVEVEGSVFDGATLVATKVEREDDDDDDDDGEVEIEGFVTAFTSSASFAVNGRSVATSSRTRYSDGTAADLALNVRVEVEGRLDANGVLLADTVEFRDDLDDLDDDDGPGRAEIEDVITAIPAADTIVAGGVTIRLTSRTRFEDHGDDDDQFLNAAALRVGDFVEVRGRVLPGNVVEAVILERDDDDDEASLRGPVTAVAQPAVSILGVSIETDGSTRFEDDDRDLTAEEFFAAVSVGDVIEADLRPGTGTRVAAEVEIESDDDDDDDDDDDSDD